MGTYIDFIEAMPGNNALISEFKERVKESTSDELSRWFRAAGYEVSSTECAIILNSMKTNYLALAAMLPY